MLPAIMRNRGSLVGPSFDDFVERFFYGWPDFDKSTDVSWAPRADIERQKRNMFWTSNFPAWTRRI